jgi:hypothetical protein
LIRLSQFPDRPAQIHCADRGWRSRAGQGRGANLRTSYGPSRPNSAHLNGQPWTLPRSRSPREPWRPDLAVKGSRVQISPARPTKITPAAWSGLVSVVGANPRPLSTAGAWPHFAPTTPKCAARLGQRGCIWVLIAGCYRWVLVSGNPLQHVQRNPAICHPGQAPGCGQAGGACPRFAAGLIAPPQVRLGVALLQRPFPLRSARS